MPSAFNRSLADPPRVLLGKILSGSLVITGALGVEFGSVSATLLDSGVGSDAVFDFESRSCWTPTVSFGLALFATGSPITNPSVKDPALEDESLGLSSSVTSCSGMNFSKDSSVEAVG